MLLKHGGAEKKLARGLATPLSQDDGRAGLGVPLGEFVRRRARRLGGWRRRQETGVLGVPFRARPAHIVQVRPVCAAVFAGDLQQFAQRLRETTPHDTLPYAFLPVRPARGRGSLFSNACLIPIVGDRSLKFVAISAAPRSKCGQTLQRLNVIADLRAGRRSGGAAGKRALPSARSIATSIADFPEMSARSAAPGNKGRGV